MDEPLQGEFSYRVVNEGKAVNDSFLIRTRTGIEALIRKQKNRADPLFSAIAASVATFKSLVDGAGFVGFS